MADRGAPRASKTQVAPVGHSIRVASELTRIPIETLRMWERRYAFPKPSRRADNHRRVYSEEDVARLRLMAQLVERGYRPGDVVRHDARGLERLLAQVTAAEEQSVGGPAAGLAAVARILRFAKAYDVAALEAELRGAAAALGPRRFVVEFAHPLVVAVGAAWKRGELDIAHEHVLSQALRTQLRTMLSAFQDVRARPVVLLTTLPGETHELGLEMVALYLSLDAAKPRMLGAETPVDEIAAAAIALKADVVGLTVTGAMPFAAASRAVRRLTENLPRRVALWVGGAQARALAAENKAVRAVESWSDLDEAVDLVRDAARP
ncbi:MAG: cobalamin-dependent protein [Polyangiales bacterium]